MAAQASLNSGTQASPVLVAQLGSSSTATPVAPVAAGGVQSGVGTISGATDGVQIIRGGQQIGVTGEQALLAGDRVIVPEGGSANVSFPGSGANEAPLAGTFTGGTDATIGTTPQPGGGQQVTVDLAAGDLVVTPDDAASDLSLIHI